MGKHSTDGAVVERRAAETLITALNEAGPANVSSDLVGPGKAIESWEVLADSIKKEMPYAVGVTIEQISVEGSNIDVTINVLNLTSHELSVAVRVSLKSTSDENVGEFKVFDLAATESEDSVYSLPMIGLPDATVSVTVMTDREEYHPYTASPMSSFIPQQRYRV